MTTDPAPATPPLTPISERSARDIPGWAPLAIGLAAIASGVASHGADSWLRVVLWVVGALALLGLTPVSPGEARVTSSSAATPGRCTPPACAG